jgi:hypothetical protein
MLEGASVAATTAPPHAALATALFAASLPRVHTLAGEDS